MRGDAGLRAPSRRHPEPRKVSPRRTSTREADMRRHRTEVLRVRPDVVRKLGKRPNAPTVSGRPHGHGSPLLSFGVQRGQDPNCRHPDVQRGHRSTTAVIPDVQRGHRSGIHFCPDTRAASHVTRVDRCTGYRVRTDHALLRQELTTSLAHPTAARRRAVHGRECDGHHRAVRC